MDTLNALLRAIITQPDEDTPRLEYADCIQERGEPGDEERAEFIRVQVERTRIGSTDVKSLFITDMDRLKELKEREKVLQKQCKNWFQPSGCKGWPISGWHRGFPIQIDCTAEDFLHIADSLIWHENQTVECENCQDRKRKSRYHCPRCKGLGKLPRPCPPTAQPIRKVVLTTTPESTGNINQFALWKKLEKGEPWRSHRWEGVEFQLPTQQPVEDNPDSAVGDPDEHLSYP